MGSQLNITQTDRVKDWVALLKSSQKSPSTAVKSERYKMEQTLLRNYIGKDEI